MKLIRSAVIVAIAGVTGALAVAPTAAAGIATPGRTTSLVIPGQLVAVTAISARVWKQVSTPGGNGVLNGVAATSARNAWAVGLAAGRR